MKMKALFVLAVLAIGIVVPAAMAANPVWEFNYWGSKDSDGGWYGNQGAEKWGPDGVRHSASAPSLSYDGSTLFEIELHNVEAPRLTKTITAWWWFTLSDSVPPSNLLKYLENVQMIPFGTQAPYAVHQVGGFEVLDPSMITETGRSKAKNHFVDGNGNSLLPEGGYVVKGVWQITPQPGDEILKWTRPNNEKGDANVGLFPCEGSRFYVNSQCAPGLPAFALIGIPPFVGALVRRAKKR